MRRSISFLVLSVICICAATAAVARSTAEPAKLTLQNLQTAFNGESNAHAVSRFRGRKPTRKVISRSPVSSGPRREPKGFTPAIMKSR